METLWQVARAGGREGRRSRRRGRRRGRGKRMKEVGQEQSPTAEMRNYAGDQSGRRSNRKDPLER